MIWSTEEFLSILNSDLAKNILADKEIADYVSSWREENKAALFHANGITEKTSIEVTKPRLQLVAAFARKDLERVKELIFKEKISVGVRLDYLLPLYDEKNDGGEDVFVASAKTMLGGNAKKNVELKKGDLVYKVGEKIGELYPEQELQQLAEYVNSAYEMRSLLKLAPNKTCIQPTSEALEYMLHCKNNYRDSNGNPTIVFIAGAISIQGYSIPKMIETVAQKEDVNQIGFFGHTGIVWSIILADIEAVETYVRLGAKLDIEDEMGNKNLLAWASSTFTAVADNHEYQKRLMAITERYQSINNVKISCTKGLFFDKIVDDNPQHQSEYLFSNGAGQ